MAIGSSNEMSVLIEYSKDLGYMSEEQYVKASKEYDEIGRMLNSLIKAVGKGTCTIYVYARNGYAKKVKVTVK